MLLKVFPKLRNISIFLSFRQHVFALIYLRNFFLHPHFLMMSPSAYFFTVQNENDPALLEEAALAEDDESSADDENEEFEDALVDLLDERNGNLEEQEYNAALLVRNAPLVNRWRDRLVNFLHERHRGLRLGYVIVQLL